MDSKRMDEVESESAKRWRTTVEFLDKNSFLLGALTAIGGAAVYPPLGSKYVAPKVTASWVAVIYIFLMTGISLRTRELVNAFQQLKFNCYVQFFNLFVVSAFMFSVSRLLTSDGIDLLSDDLGDGVIIGSCMPVTVNMVIMLTKSSNGDEGAAVFHAVAGSLLGVFIIPFTLQLYLGQTGEIETSEVIFKLILRVVIPLFIGQVFQYKSERVVEYFTKHKKFFKKTQEGALIFIVYTVFSRNFESGTEASATDILLVIAVQFFGIIFVMALAWSSMAFLFEEEYKLRVMGLFGCTHKSVAMGIPLINAIYEGNPKVGMYTLPLILWHVTQLIVGTFIAPRLALWVDEQEAKSASKVPEEMEVHI